MQRILFTILTFSCLTAWAADPFELMVRKQAELRAEAEHERQNFLYPGGERFTDNNLKNDVITLRWFAAAGDVESQAILGDIYAKGVIEPQNLESAVYWYNLAAEYDVTYAQYMMALSYQFGWLGEPDAEKASEWFNRAHEQIDALRAQRLVAQFFNDRESAQYNFNEAFRWYERAANNGDLEAQINLAEWYFNGDVIGRDILTAIKWYGRAAAQKDPYAQYSLGLIYLNGDDLIPIDYTSAVEWIERAAWQNYSAAQYTLGRLYASGIGVPANDMQAYAWWTMANKFDNPAVTRDLARVTKKMSMEQLNQAAKVATFYQREIAGHG